MTTKTKETQHFENDDGTCEECINIGYNKCLAEVEKMIWKYPDEFIMEAETKDEAESIKSEIIQKLKEIQK